MKEIAFDTLTMMPKDSFVLIDIRDEGLTSYGMIPGAVNIPVDKLEDENNQQIADISKEKKLVFYCQIGRRSKELDNLACIEGREAYAFRTDIPDTSGSGWTIKPIRKKDVLRRKTASGGNITSSCSLPLREPARHIG